MSNYKIALLNLSEISYLLNPQWGTGCYYARLSVIIAGPSNADMTIIYQQIMHYLLNKARTKSKHEQQNTFSECWSISAIVDYLDKPSTETSKVSLYFIVSGPPSSQ